MWAFNNPRNCQTQPDKSIITSHRNVIMRIRHYVSTIAIGVTFALGIGVIGPQNHAIAADNGEVIIVDDNNPCQGANPDHSYIEGNQCFCTPGWTGPTCDEVDWDYPTPENPGGNPWNPNPNPPGGGGGGIPDSFDDTGNNDDDDGNDNDTPTCLEMAHVAYEHCSEVFAPTNAEYHCRVTLGLTGTFLQACYEVTLAEFEQECIDDWGDNIFACSVFQSTTN